MLHRLAQILRPMLMLQLSRIVSTLVQALWGVPILNDQMLRRNRQKKPKKPRIVYQRTGFSRVRTRFKRTSHSPELPSPPAGAIAIAAHEHSRKQTLKPSTLPKKPLSSMAVYLTAYLATVTLSYQANLSSATQ